MLTPAGEFCCSVLTFYYNVWWTRRESFAIIDVGETVPLEENVILLEETCSLTDFIVWDGVITLSVFLKENTGEI